MSSEREEQVKATLEEIRKANGGRLTRQAVLEYARANKKSALGKMFDWDMKKAANTHWLDRAQEIITRYITIVVVDSSLKIRAPFYVSDPRAKTNEGGYVGLVDKHTRNDALQIVVNELDRIIGAVERARDIALALDTQHHGMSEQLQRMLTEAVTMKRRLAA